MVISTFNDYQTALTLTPSMRGFTSWKDDSSKSLADTWTITDNGDSTSTIACIGNDLQVSWWYYDKPERNWYCFRLNSTIEVVS